MYNTRRVRSLCDFRRSMRWTYETTFIQACVLYWGESKILWASLNIITMYASYLCAPLITHRNARTRVRSILLLAPPKFKFFYGSFDSPYLSAYHSSALHVLRNKWTNIKHYFWPASLYTDCWRHSKCNSYSAWCNGLWKTYRVCISGKTSWSCLLSAWIL